MTTFKSNSLVKLQPLWCSHPDRSTAHRPTTRTLFLWSSIFHFHSRIRVTLCSAGSPPVLPFPTKSRGAAPGAPEQGPLVFVMAKLISNLAEVINHSLSKYHNCTWKRLISWQTIYIYIYAVHRAVQSTCAAANYYTEVRRFIERERRAAAMFTWNEGYILRSDTRSMAESVWRWRVFLTQRHSAVSSIRGSFSKEVSA